MRATPRLAGYAPPCAPQRWQGGSQAGIGADLSVFGKTGVRLTAGCAGQDSWCDFFLVTGSGFGLGGEQNTHYTKLRVIAIAALIKKRI